MTPRQACRAGLWAQFAVLLGTTRRGKLFSANRGHLRAPGALLIGFPISVVFSRSMACAIKNLKGAERENFPQAVQ